MIKKIYTKNGDGGKTGTFKGRMEKSAQLAVALGSVDELNSWIGVCRSQLLVDGYHLANMEKNLWRIQGNLLTIGSGLSGSGVKLGSGETKKLENLIDKLTAELPKLGNFIYPTGKGAAAFLQVARTVARRAEREVVKYKNEENMGKPEKREDAVKKYLNRLSDALFTMGRWVNWKTGGGEEIWKS